MSVNRKTSLLEEAAKKEREAGNGSNYYNTKRQAESSAANKTKSSKSSLLEEAARIEREERKTTQRQTTSSAANSQTARDLAVQRMKQAQTIGQKIGSTSVGKLSKPTSHSGSSGTWAENSNPAYKQWAANNQAQAGALENKSKTEMAKADARNTAKTALQTGKGLVSASYVDPLALQLLETPSAQLNFKSSAEAKLAIDVLESERVKLTTPEKSYGLVKNPDMGKLASTVELKGKIDEIKSIQKQLEEAEKKALIDSGEYRDASFFEDLLWNSLNKGWYQADLGKAYHRGEKTKAEAIENALESDRYKYLPRNLFEEAVSGAAEQVGLWGNTILNWETVASGGAAAAATALAGVAGPQAAIPEEIITVPTALGVGITMGTTKQMYEIEAGLAYKELIEEGVSPETATLISEGVGVINAGLEMFQVDEVVKAAKILIKNPGTKRTATNLLKSLAKLGVNVVFETAQEDVQELVTIGGTQLGSKIDTGEFAYSLGEMGERLLDTTKQSALTFGMLSGTSAVAGHTVGKIADIPRAKSQKKVRETAEKVKNDVESFVEVVEYGKSRPEGTKAHDTATRIYDKMQNGEEVSTDDVAELIVENSRAYMDENIDLFANNEDNLQALVEEGHDIGGKSSKIADRIASKVNKGQEVTRDDIRQLIAANEKVDAAEQQKARAEALKAEEQQTAETARRFTGYGDKGITMFLEETVEKGADAISVKTAMDAPYHAGRFGIAQDKVDLSTPLARQAYNVGEQDRILDIANDKKVAEEASVWGEEAGLIKNEHSKSLPLSKRILFDEFAKQQGTKIVMRDRIYTDNKGGEANGRITSDGVIEVSMNADNPLEVVVTHEGTHNAKRNAPEAWGAFVDFSVKMKFGEYKAGSKDVITKMREGYYIASNGDVLLDSVEAAEEVATHYAERIVHGNEAFLQDVVSAIRTELAKEDASVSENGVSAETTKKSKLREFWESFLEWVQDKIAKLKALRKNPSIKNNSIARADLDTTIENLERGKELLQNLFAESAKTVQAKRDAGKVHTETAQKNTTAESGVKYSIELGGYADIKIDVQSELDFFNISSLNDYIKVQNAVYNRLEEEGFFDAATGRRTVENIDTGMVVDIGWEGIKETFGPGKRYKELPRKLKELKIATIRSLPDVIRYGEITSDNQENYHQNGSDVLYAYFEHPVSVDGMVYYLVVDIRKTRQVNKFWVHGVYLNSKKRQALDASAENSGNAINKDLSFDETLPQNGRNVKKNYSLKDSTPAPQTVDDAINQSMTMEQAKDMVQRAFVLGGIKEWFEGEYRNGDEWLKGEGSDAVAMVVENEWQLQERFINKVQGILDEDFTVTDVLEAYLAGTLTGATRKVNQPQRLNVASGSTALDTRFYAPRQIENAKAAYEVASQKATNKNRDAVNKARADIIMFAHTRGAAEALGLTQAELNAKVRQWARYTARAKEVSQKFNAGVAEWNRWTGIENSNLLNRATVSNEDLDRLVGTITGDNDGFQRKYIMRTMLALDTHIDYTGLNFEFVGRPMAGRDSVNGLYSDSERKIRVKYNAPHTVAHEMGHYLDHQWARDIGVSGAMTDKIGRNRITDAETKQWATNFDIFREKLDDVADIGSGYTMDSGEVFARFVDKFVRWVNFTANGEQAGLVFDRNDKFTAQHYIEFVRLLQEKSVLDGKRMSNPAQTKQTDGATSAYGRKQYSLKDSTGKSLTDQQSEFFKDSKVVDGKNRLKVVYHGTNSEFNTFRIGDIGFHFGNKTTARTRSGRGKTARLMECYLNITNPIEFDTDFGSWDASHRLAEALVERGIIAEEEYRIVLKTDSGYTRSDGDANTVLRKMLQEKGYDGIIYRNYFETNGSVSYIVFDSNQAKLTDNETPTKNPDIRYSLKGVRELEDAHKQAEINDLLRKELADVQKALAEQIEKTEKWKGELKRTKTPTVDKKSVDKLTRKIVREYDSDADVAEISEQLKELGDYLLGVDTNEGLANAKAKADAIARTIVEESRETYVDSYLDEIKRTIRATKIFVPEWVRRSIPDYEHFRKRNFGRMRLSHNEGTSIDVFWNDMNGQFGEFFNEQEISNSVDQLLKLEEIINSAAPLEFNPFGEGEAAAEVIDALGYDLIVKLLQDVDPTPPTFADKAYEKQKQAVKDAKEQVRETERERYEKKLADQKRKSRERLKTLVSEQKRKAQERYEKRVSKLKERHREQMANASERVKARDLRDKITRHTDKLYRKLLKSTKTQNIPFELHNVVKDVLAAINMESNFEWVVGSDGKRRRVQKGADPNSTPTKRTEAFIKLRKECEEIADKNIYGIEFDPNLLKLEDGARNMLQEIVDMYDTPISSMSVEQLDTVWRVLRAVERAVLDAGKILTNDFMREKYVDRLALANAFFEAAETRKTHTTSDRHWTMDLMDPYTYFSQFGQPGLDFYRMLRNAQDDYTVKKKEIADMVSKIVSAEKRAELEKDINEFETQAGEKLILSKAHIMDMWLLNNRQQGKQHLLGGGIYQPTIKGKVKKGTSPTRLTELDLGKIFATLTEEDRKFAQEFRKITDKLAEWADKANVRVYGYEKFGDPNYWTINVNKKGTKQKVNTNPDNSRSVADMSAAKNTVPEARNAVDIFGMFETFDRHASDMLNFAAWLAPSKDAEQLFNIWIETESGELVNNEFKDMLDRVGGAKSSDYWMELMEDIENGIKGKQDTEIGGFVEQAIGKTRRAAIASNMRVVIQQPTAAARALAVIDPKYLAKGLVKGVTEGKGADKARKYSPTALRKFEGNFDIGTGVGSLADAFYKPESLKGKGINVAKEGSLWAAGKADELTWGKLWNACEHQIAGTRKDLTVGSEEWYTAVKELFDDTIDQTQVVDGILQRSKIMRSGSALAKQLTAFKGEPLKTANMLMRSVNNWRHETDPKKRSAARKKAARSAFALTLNVVVNAVAQSIWDGIRDDDDEEKLLKRALNAFAGLHGDEETWRDFTTGIIFGNLVSGLNPLNYIPLASDVVSIFEGYDVNRPDAEAWSRFMQEVKNTIGALGEDGGKQKLGYSVTRLLTRAGYLFGSGSSNLLRDIESVVRSVQVETDSFVALYKTEKLKYDVVNNKSKFIGILYNAYAAGDMKAYEAIYRDLIKSGVSEKSITSAMESRMMKAEGVSKASELEDRYLSPTKQKQYDKTMSPVKKSSLWSKASAKQKSDAETLARGLVNGSNESAAEKIKTGAELGLSADEWVMYQLALDIYDTPSESGKLGGSPTVSEQANAILAVPGLSDAEMAFLFDGKLNDGKAYRADEAGLDMEEYLLYRIALAKVAKDLGTTTESTKAKKETFKQFDFSASEKRYLREED